MKYVQLLAVKKEDGTLDYIWHGSIYAPVLVTDMYRIDAIEPLPNFLTQTRPLPERLMVEYVRNDTWLKGLLPFAYKAYYYLQKYFWKFLRLLNRIGIMHTPIGAYPSWKDFFRNAN